MAATTQGPDRGDTFELVQLTDKADAYPLERWPDARLALAGMVNDPNWCSWIGHHGPDPRPGKVFEVRRIKSEQDRDPDHHYVKRRSCDRLAIMDHGKVLTESTPAELISQLAIPAW